MIKNDHEIQVRYVPLPESVKGCVTLLEDDSYLIVINSTLPEDVQEEALKHEMEHIHREDLLQDKPMDVSLIESTVHDLIEGSH